MLTNDKPQSELRLRFVFGQLKTFPQMFLYILLQHCCLLVEFDIFDMKHLLFCTAWINDEEYIFFAIYFFVNSFLWCDSTAVYCVLLFCLSHLSFLSCFPFLVTHFFFFIFLWFFFCLFFFFPSVQVDEKLLYFVYKNLGKQAFVKMKKKIKFVLFLLHPSVS